MLFGQDNPMNKVKMAVYGTLRQDAAKNYNFGRFGQQTKLGELWLNGFKLMNLGAYPYVDKGIGQVFVEVHEVDEETFESIKRMEEGAGYVTEKVERVLLENGDIVDCFIFRMREVLARLYEKSGRAMRIESGDWNILEL